MNLIIAALILSNLLSWVILISYQKTLDSQYKYMESLNDAYSVVYKYTIGQMDKEKNERT